MKKISNDFIRKFLTMILVLAMVLGNLNVPMSVQAEGSNQTDIETIISQTIISQMTLDEKISQLIIPAIRTFKVDNASEARDVTVLSDFPQLEEALRKHQYGGVILYAANVKNTEQIVRLTTDLQKNNAKINTITNIPYFMPVDEEGGIVLRILSGTRMTGNMAIGATGEKAEENAYITGKVLGSECIAAGFNINFAPDVDVNNNPANPVIGTRAFSDDPDTVSTLGLSYARGLEDSGVEADKGAGIIGCYKHFPGHGDTGTDSHLGLPTVDKSYEELKKTELVPFKKAIEEGAEMIMTAHITYPQIDEKVVFPDGQKGCYPATMSKKIIQGILREDMGFNGLVVADALEMDALKVKLVDGEVGTVEYCANVAEKVINAGVDILLLPMDMKDPEAITFYDEYINTLKEKVNNGKISEDRINESLGRILELKIKRGILFMDTSGDNVEDAVARAETVIGSSEHHSIEMDMARQAVTLVKNENSILPLAGINKKMVFLCRSSIDNVTILRSIKGLQGKGVIDPAARIINRVDQTESGDENAATRIIIDSYENGKSTDADIMKEDIQAADVVVGLSKNFNLAALQETNWQYTGIKTAMDDVHSAGGKFILLSNNLPYDSARFQEADGILLAYMGSGTGTTADPTDKEGAYEGGAYNATVEAAIQTAFGDNKPSGILPVKVLTIGSDGEGKVSYTDQVLYPRGFGLTYDKKDSESDTSQPEDNTSKTEKKDNTNKTEKKDNTNKTVKKNNTLIAKGKTVKIKYSKVKKKAQKIKRKKIITIKKAKGKVSYKKLSVNKKKYAGKFLVNKKTGKLTVKPGVKKGKYKIRIKVKAAGNKNYKSGSKKVTVIVRVR